MQGPIELGVEGRELRASTRGTHKVGRVAHRRPGSNNGLKLPDGQASPDVRRGPNPDVRRGPNPDVRRGPKVSPVQPIKCSIISIADFFLGLVRVQENMGKRCGNVIATREHR